MAGRAAAVDPVLKVTGQARYAAEFPAADLAYVALVLSTIASGRIRRIDTAAAQRAPGVLAVFTHENIRPWHKAPEDSEGKLGEKQLPLTSDEIHYDGEIIGLVAATSFESAQEAARLVALEYETRVERTPGVARWYWMALLFFDAKLVGFQVLESAESVGKALRRGTR